MLAERYLSSGDLDALRALFVASDDAAKASVLNAVWAEPRPEIGPSVVTLAIEAATHASAAVRTEACSVFQNQCAWGVDVSGVLEPLRMLLDDPNDRVRQQAAFATGNLAKRRYPMASHVEPLVRNLQHEDKFVRDSSAWALWQLSRRKHDIGTAVGALVSLLSDRDPWDGPRKNAAGALLRHARRSPGNARSVKLAVKAAHLKSMSKTVARFLEELSGVG
jgi:HEAT repeat protein